MKKLSYHIFAVLVTVISVYGLTRFGKFAIDGTSIWQEFGWIRLVPFAYLFGLFLIKTIAEAHHGGWSGWVYQGIKAEYTEDDKKVKFYQASYFWFTIGALLIELGIFFLSLSDR